MGEYFRDGGAVVVAITRDKLIDSEDFLSERHGEGQCRLAMYHNCSNG